jgi:transposase
VLRLEEWTRINELARQGMGIRAIARTAGISRNTVSKYLEGGPPAPRTRSRRPSPLDSHRDYIRSRLAEYDLTAKRLLDEIRVRGYTGGYTAVKDFVQALRADRKVQAVYRFETPPGEQAQVDWAHVGMIQVDGRPRKLYAFVMVLSHSRCRFVRFTVEADAAAFVRLHKEAFEELGGFPRTVLYDNAKVVVLERGASYDERQWNPLFLDFCNTLGFRPHLCAPYRAQTKGKVERSIRMLREGFVNGREFSSLAEMNTEVQGWLRHINHEVPNSTTGRIPADLLASEGLTPLDPSRPYVITESFPRKVNRECMVSFQANRYSVPWKYAGREAMVRLTGKVLTVEVAGEEVARHEHRSGAGSVVRVKEHFDGLLQAIRSTNRNEEQWRTVQYALEAVAQRPLEEYDRLLDQGALR